MRILIFSLSYIPLVGGAEVAVKEITDRIQDIEFDMVTLRFDKSHPKFEKVGNINVYRIGGGFGYLSKILFVPQAAMFAMRRHYDALWSLMTYMLLPVVIARILGNRTPYILTLQDGDPWTHVFNRFRIFPFLPLLFYGFKRAAKVQAISNFLASWALKMGHKEKVEVIPNGVDVSSFKKSGDDLDKSSDEFVLITTSRLVEKNGIGDIIEALQFLPENVKLKILGTGPLEKKLKEKSRKLNVSERIEFLGYVQQQDIPAHLWGADAFVRPSLSEGMGNSFIEAMAAGLPIIGTPVGGIPDFLKDGETGLFCEPSDPKSIARQIERLMKDGELRNKLIENGRKLAGERYDWSLIVNEMKTLVFDKV